MTAQAIVKITIMVNAGMGCVSANILDPSNSNIILKRIWAIIKEIEAFDSIEIFFEIFMAYFPFAVSMFSAKNGMESVLFE